MFEKLKNYLNAGLIFMIITKTKKNFLENKINLALTIVS